MDNVDIGGRKVGPGEPCYVIAEIGINHNGDVEIAKDLIDAASECGADAVKFQKRTVDVVYTPEELARPRESPWGTTNGDQKRGLELSAAEFCELNQYSPVPMFASCWDEESIWFMENLRDGPVTLPPPAYKIASASLTDDNLLREHRRTGRPLILSTGMSTVAEIDHAVEVLGTEDLILLHCNSSYPGKDEELNLRCIPWLAERYDVPVGYSGHELGVATSVAAVALGACVVERHLTLNRAMYGSDQAASMEPQGFRRMVRDIRSVEAAMGDGVKRVYDSELPAREKLRRK